MRHCDICGYNDFEKIGEKQVSDVQTRSGVVEFSVRQVICRNCGLVFQDPPYDKDKLRSYYSHMYRGEGCRPSTCIKGEIKPRVDFLNRFRTLKTNQSVFEIGCADGTTLLELQKNGFSVRGIEPSIENARLCKQKGLDVFNGFYEDYTFDLQRFDFICSYYLMEHLASPVHFLSFCNKNLKTNGTLCFEVPDIGAYKLETTTSDLLFFFEHQYHFTRETVGILLQRCGFRLLSFADNTTNAFGMHLAARREADPLSINNLQIPAGIFDRVMAQIDEYREHFLTKLSVMKENVKDLLSGKEDRQKRVIMFGAGSYAKMLLESTNIDTSSIAAIVDNNRKKWGTRMNGIKVVSPDIIDSSVDVVVVASSYHEEIQEQLRQMGIGQEKIFIV